MTTDNELEEAAELYCPDRTVKMPNGEDLFIIHSKKQGFLAGARYAAEKSAERIEELEAGLREINKMVLFQSSGYSRDVHLIALQLLSPKDTQGVK